MTGRHSSRRSLLHPLPLLLLLPPNLHPGRPGGEWEDRPFASYQCSKLYSPRSPAQHEEGERRDPGEVIGARSTKGRWPCTRGAKAKEAKNQSLTRPTAAAARTAAPFFFCLLLPCLPVMRIIPASAGWQAQHGLCSGSGSGSGISTRARGALSRPRRRARPFRQHLVRPGCGRGHSRRRELRPRENGGGGRLQLRVAILGEYSVIILSSSVDRGLLFYCLSSLPSPPSRPTGMGWMVQTRLPASHRWPASPPSPPRVIIITRKGEGRGRRPLLRRPRIALPAQDKKRENTTTRTPTHTHTHNLNGVEGQRTSCRKYHLVEDHCGPCPHT